MRSRYTRSWRLLTAILAVALAGEASAATCTWLGVTASAKDRANATCAGGSGGIPADGADQASIGLAAAAPFRLEYAGIGDPAQPASAAVAPKHVTGNVTLDTTIVGAGHLVSTPAGIDCPDTCSASFPTGTAVTLAQTPAPGRGFGGWSGACSGLDATCTLAMDSSQAVTATFPGAAAITIVSGDAQAAWVDTAFAQPLVVEVSTAGGMPVIDATVLFAAETSTNGASATLSAATATTGTDGRALVHATANAIVGGPYAVTAILDRATFPPASFVLNNVAAPAPVALTVTKSGAGSGLVSGPGIACGNDCSETLAIGTTVQLVAQADASSVFAGWSGGGCSGTGACTVMLAAATTIDARFDRTSADPVPALGGLGLLALVLGAMTIAWGMREGRA